MTFESPWTRKIMAELKSMNALNFAIVGGQMQEVGWPDRILNHTYSGTVYLEFKAKNTRSTTKQRWVIRELNRRGCLAYFVRHPGIVENYRHEQLGTFDGTGRDLLVLLRLLAPGWAKIRERCMQTLPDVSVEQALASKDYELAGALIAAHLDRGPEVV